MSGDETQSVNLISNSVVPSDMTLWVDLANQETENNRKSFSFRAFRIRGVTLGKTFLSLKFLTDLI